MTGALLNFDEYFKRLDFSDGFVRRNPLYYGSIRRQLDSLLGCTLAQRKVWTQRRLGSILAAARRTPYGRGIGDARQLTDWPLLQKDRLRENPAAFHSGAWFTVRASTGGTSGTPLELVRSPSSVVMEQVVLDRSSARSVAIRARRASLCCEPTPSSKPRTIVGCSGSTQSAGADWFSPVLICPKARCRLFSAS